VTRGIALVRRPGPRLPDGQVARPRPEPVDLDRALHQHAGYRDALGAAGWQVVEAAPADDLPDATFVEDTAALDAPVLAAPEPAGAALLLLGETRIGLSAAAPRTGDLLAAHGLEPVTLDIGEFEALDAGPTCLSVLLPGAVRSSDGTVAG